MGTFEDGEMLPCAPLKFDRWANTGHIRAGVINKWSKDRDVKQGEYVYDDMLHKFFRSLDGVNDGERPRCGSEHWEYVEEGDFSDGLKESEIIIDISHGDVAIRPLYRHCETATAETEDEEG
jgi:hypothetical protein